MSVSQEMSGAAGRYKEMLGELHKNSGRLAKMEQAASSAAIQKKAGSGGSSFLMKGKPHIASPTDVQIEAAKKRQEAIADLRAALDKAAQAAGLPPSSPPASSSGTAKPSRPG